VTTIDIPAIAETLAKTYPTIPTGTTVKTGGRTAAETIEGLIDAAAQAGAFTDLADRPSIEVSTLTHADRTVWVLLEFDRDHKLLRAGPVPVGELTGPGTPGPVAIADILTRVRGLLATAIVLGTRPAKPMRITAVQRPHQGRLPMLALTGPALQDIVLDTARTVALDGAEHDDGPARRLGRALIAYRTSPPTSPQTAGPDALAADHADLLDQTELAEAQLTEALGPARVGLNLFGAAALVATIIQAIAATDEDTPLHAPSSVLLACTKRRQQCTDSLTSVRTAQRFVIDLARTAAPDEAAGWRHRAAQINAAAVQSATMAMMLAELAEQADLHGEQHAAQAAEDASAGFEDALRRAEHEAWEAAAEALRKLVAPERHRAQVEDWERTAGLSIPTGWTHPRTH
jgi:hypothetical protein